MTPEVPACRGQAGYAMAIQPACPAGSTRPTQLDPPADSMIDLCGNYSFVPDHATANAELIRKTIVADAVLDTVEKALEAVGEGGLFRTLPLERLLRGAHGAQFHPLQRNGSCVSAVVSH